VALESSLDSSYYKTITIFLSPDYNLDIAAMSVNTGHERVILETHGILIKNQYYFMVLTSRQIIFTNENDNKKRSIPLPAVLAVELGMDPRGPVLMVSAPSAQGEVKNVILCFSQRDFPHPQQLRSLWYSEIRKRIQQPAQGSSYIPRDHRSDTPAFCTKCGKKLADGSFFCDGCGTKISFPVEPVSPDQDNDRIQDRVIRPEISSGTIGLPRKEQAFSYHDDPGNRDNVPVTAAKSTEKWKKKSLFSGFPKKKSLLIIGICLAAVCIVAAGFFIVFPSNSWEFNLTFPGLNVFYPNISAVRLPGSFEGNPSTNPETTGSLANPEEASMPEGTEVRPALTFEPGDPGAVLSTYPILFNNGDGAGLYALVSDNIKSQYTVDALDTELADARSGGYQIEQIRVTDQIFEGENAMLITEISWMNDGNPITSTPNIPIVYEHNQWKLDTLVLHP
jgi:hypothetical protein